ncbi:MAG: fibronectin type III domain-containing protein, partial [Solirubrobacteraceae bacterium]
MLVIGLLIAPTTAVAATRPPAIVPSYLSHSAVSTHFVLHYTDDSAAHPADAISTTAAANAVGVAENAYGWYVGAWGYPAPLNDGDGKTDIYVFDLGAIGVDRGGAATTDDDLANQTSGYILLSPTTATFDPFTIAHELFHVIQFGLFHARFHFSSLPPEFFGESTAEWAANAVWVANGGNAFPEWYRFPQISLNCVSSSCVGNSGAVPGGYMGETFWEYLSERFGMGIVKAAYERDAELGATDHAGHDIEALEDVLTSRGSSLADAMNGYARGAIAGEITRPGVLPNLPVAAVSLDASQPGIYPPRQINVNHLALKRIAVTAGASADATSCAEATLGLSVDLPAAAESRPVFVVYPPSGLPPASAVYPLKVSGTVASAEIPWRTDCAHELGALVLPNASATADDQGFTVDVKVDGTIAPAPTLPSVGRAPAVSTGVASSITASGASWGGIVNPNGQATSYQFDYGTTTAYGSKTTPVSVGSGTTDDRISQRASGLRASTTYHYRIEATNATGTSHGADRTFTTPPRIDAMRLTPARFRTLRSGPSVLTNGTKGTKLSYRLSGRAIVTFRIERVLSGRRKGNSCLPDTRARHKLRSCTRYALLKGNFMQVGKAGRTSFRFTGRLGGKTLAAGK